MALGGILARGPENEVLPDQGVAGKDRDFTALLAVGDDVGEHGLGVGGKRECQRGGDCEWDQFHGERVVVTD